MAENLRAVLASQYHASLAMLRETIERCSDEMWTSPDYTNAFWQVAYHTLFFAHVYLGEDEAAFKPWKHHQALVQHPDGIAGDPDPKSKLPLIPNPYTRAQVLEYWQFCDNMVNDALASLDLTAPTCGFKWYQVSKLEHQLINIRHIQHGAAQLADRLRAAAGIGIKWVGRVGGAS